MTVISTQDRRITIQVVEHKTSELLVAMSDDLPGLVFAARSEEELQRGLPGVIKDLLEAEGHVVLSVTATSDDSIPASFVGHTIVASARLESAHE